jgi:hypothetical protein
MDFPTMIDLYRSTFLCIVQDRFRSMLDDLNSVTTVQDVERFDSALQDHLDDVWSAIRVDRRALSESFAKELLDSFVRFLDQTNIGELKSDVDIDEGAAWRADRKIGYRRTFAADESLAHRILEIELQNRQSIHQVNEAYGALRGRAPEPLSVIPWSPAAVLNAFSTVLDQLEFPIHHKVRLVLYGNFIDTVLRQVDEACLAFRDGLNELRRQKGTRSELPPGGKGATPPVQEGIGNTVGYGFSFKEIMPGKGAQPESTAERSTSLGEPEMPWFRRYTRVFAFLLLTALLGAVAWRLGTQLAERRLGNVAQNENLPQTKIPSRRENPSPPESAPPSADAESTSTENTSSVLATEQYAQPPAVSDPHAKSEAIRAVELIDYDWTVEPVEKTMLFNFSIRNGSKRRISEVEVVCLQYTNDLELLEPLKAVLSGVIEPNMTKDFKKIPAGFANSRVDRVSCIIPDLTLE